MKSKKSQNSKKRENELASNMMSLSIEKFLNYNINEEDISKLQNPGIYIVNDLLMAKKEELTIIKGMSEKKNDIMVENLVSQGQAKCRQKRIN